MTDEERQILSKNYSGKSIPPEIGQHPKQTFAQNMTKVAPKFELKTFKEYTNLDSLKEVKAGAGIKLPFTEKDSTVVTTGLEAHVSVFNTPAGTKATKGILPTIRVSQDIGKNCKLTASVRPKQTEFARIGINLNF